MLGARVRDVPLERVVFERIAGGRPLDPAAVRRNRVFLQFVPRGGSRRRHEELDADEVRPHRVVFEDVAGCDDVEANGRKAAAGDDVVLQCIVDASEHEDADAVPYEGVVLDVVVARVASEHDPACRVVAEFIVLDGVPDTSALEVDTFSVRYEGGALDHDIGRGVDAHGHREVPDGTARDRDVGSSGHGNTNAAAGPGDRVTIRWILMPSAPNTIPPASA